MATFTTAISQVESLYVGYFGRAADPSGANYWIVQLNAGAITLAQMAASFAAQPEAMSKYPYLVAPSISDPGTFVDQVYQNLFNHLADAAGKAYWVAQLNAAKGSPSAVGAMILNIISGATGTDSTTISNKVDVASDFTVQASNAGTTWNNAAVAQSSAELATVTDTAASVTAAKAATTAYVASAPGPQANFTLGLDTLTSSAQNANFNAPMIFNPGTGTLVQSLQIGDSAIATAPLTGPGLSNGAIFTGMLDGLAPNVILRGIPTHTVTNVGGGIAGYSGTVTGLVNLVNNNSIGGLTIGALGAGIDAGGIVGTTTTGATLLNSVISNNTPTGATTVFVNSAALSGSSDGLRIGTTGAFGTSLAPNTISVKNDSAAAGAAMNGYEVLDIDTGAATFMRLADSTSGIASTTKITVSGAGATSLFGEATEAHFTNLTTIDGSTQTGGLTITGTGTAGGLLVGNTVLNSFKGGTGVDSLDLTSMTATQLGAFTALSGGDGRDTLLVVPGALNTTTSLSNTGFEILRTGAGLTGTIDFSKLGTGVDTIQLTGSAAGTTTFSNLPSTFTFDSGAFGNNKNFTFNGPSGLSDSLNINAGNTPVGGVYNDFTSTGFETVNITVPTTTINSMGFNGITTVTPSVGGAVTVNFLVNNNAGATAMNFAGAFNAGNGTVNISSTDASASGRVFFAGGSFAAGALDASGFHPNSDPTASGVLMSGAAASAQISIRGSAGADTFRGSGANDIIDGGAGNDILNGGAGGDLITTGTGADTVGLTRNFAQAGQSIVASGPNLSGAIAAGETLVFNAGSTGNVDRVTDFRSGTDKVTVNTPNVLPTNLFGQDGAAALNNNQNYVLYGTWNASTGTFTVAANFAAGSSQDALAFQGNGALSANAHTGTVVLVGLNQALTAADYINTV